MTFKLPTFNLNANIWRHASSLVGPPDLSSACNLALGRRVNVPLVDTATGSPAPGGMWLLLPRGTDIRDGAAASGTDFVEVPAGSGRFYESIWVDDAGAGFANEHRFAELTKHGTWPVPFPPGTYTPPVFSFTWGPSASSGFGGGPIASTLSAAGGIRFVGVGVLGSPPSLPTLSSSLVGPLGASFSLTPITDGFDTLWQLGWWYASPGGTETLTLTPAGGNAAMMLFAAMWGSNMDINTSPTSSGTPILFTSFGSTNHANEAAVAVLASNQMSAGVSIAAPWIQPPSNANVMGTVNPWSLVGAQQQVALAASHLTGTWTSPGAGPSAAATLAAAWK